MALQNFQVTVTLAGKGGGKGKGAGTGTGKRAGKGKGRGVGQRERSVCVCVHTVRLVSAVVWYYDFYATVYTCFSALFVCLDYTYYTCGMGSHD